MAESTNALGVDTSSYPKAAPIAQQNPLDTIGKLQEMGLKQQEAQQRSIGIDLSKLKLVNEKWDYSSKVLGGLLNKPDLTGKDLLDTYQHLHNRGVLTPEQFAQEASSIPSLEGIKRQNPNATPEQHREMLSQKNKDMVKFHLLQGATKMEQLNGAYGVPGPVINTPQYSVPTIYNQGKQSIEPSGQPYPTGELSPAAKVATPEGEQYYGQQPPANRLIPNKVKTIPAPALPSNALPTQDNPYVNPRSINGQSQNLTGDIIPSKPSGPMASQPPAFEAGKEQYAKAIEQAGHTLQAVKPAQQAIKLMDPDVIKGLTGTGPIAAKATQILGALQGVGVLNATEPVAQRQELVKKLAYYLKSSPSGQRSDAAQALADKANANPDVQLLPALIRITRDNIALDRVDAAAALAFQRGVRNKQFEQFLEHRGNFPNTMDERAFTLDSMPDAEKDKLIDSIKNSKSKLEKEKFARSLKLAQELKMYEQ